MCEFPPWLRHWNPATGKSQKYRVPPALQGGLLETGEEWGPGPQWCPSAPPASGLVRGCLYAVFVLSAITNLPLCLYYTLRSSLAV